jgi:O-methyltransferase domain
MVQPDVPPSPSAAVLRQLTGGWVARAVEAVATLGIADQLASGPLPVAELAARTGTDADALHRVLRALVPAGLFTVSADRYALTSAGECLRSDVPGSVRPFAVFMGAESVRRSWEGLDQTLRTGRTAFEDIYGDQIFSWYASHPEAARIAAAGLTSRSAAENDAIAAEIELGDVRRIVDVGGGEGTLLRTLLRAHPAASGVLAELPHVLALARAGLTGAPEADRVDLVETDFFASVPEGGDVFLLKKVLHDWADEPAAAILRSVRAAMADDARLLVCEFAVPADGSPSFAVLLDLLMLVYAGGRERTAAEHEALLAGAGLRLTDVVPTSAGISVLVAAPG